ncbi:MAG: HlyD family type I secretion periplasmic adaptor subunit [Acetobacteraceae bacterium]|nr:HlyD family type I secretion periplasmic adaptor subunit [Acetobacteraceae bacterium]
MASADPAPPLTRARPLRPPRPPAEALPFLDEIEALTAAPAPRALRLWPWLVGGAFAALLAAAALGRVDMVVSGTGRLVPDAPPVVLQPMERAVLRELRVRPGDAVRAGEVLALLDPSFVQADRNALAAQRRSLAAQAERLEAELAGAAMPAPTDADATLQARLREHRAALLAARRDTVAGEIRAIAAALRAAEESDRILAEQLAMAREVETLRARLLETQLNSRLQYLAARSSRIGAEQERARNAARIEELRHHLASRAAALSATEEDWRRQIVEDLARIRADLLRTEEALAKAERLDALTLLRAPRDGVVLEIASRSPGSILREAEPLITLVPSDAPLIAEITFRSAEIGRLRDGAAAVVKLDAFPHQRHGALPGRLRAVSRESFPSPGGPAHRAQIVLGPTEALRGGTPMAGMTVAAEVKVGERSALSYFLDPLLRGLRDSLREP